MTYRTESSLFKEWNNLYLVILTHSQMEAATKEVCSALTQAADDMAHFYNTHCKEYTLYEVGDKVWLEHNITTTYLMRKLDQKWLGPYVVDKVISRNDYSSNCLHPLAELTQSSESPYYGTTIQI